MVHLPPNLPEGRATLIVQVPEDDEEGVQASPSAESTGLDTVLDIDPRDMEWWEEFEDGDGEDETEADPDAQG